MWRRILRFSTQTTAQSDCLQVHVYTGGRPCARRLKQPTLSAQTGRRRSPTSAIHRRRTAARFASGAPATPGHCQRVARAVGARPAQRGCRGSPLPGAPRHGACGRVGGHREVIRGRRVARDRHRRPSRSRFRRSTWRRIRPAPMRPTRPTRPTRHPMSRHQRGLTSSTQGWTWVSCGAPCREPQVMPHRAGKK